MNGLNVMASPTLPPYRRLWIVAVAFLAAAVSVGCGDDTPAAPANPAAKPAAETSADNLQRGLKMAADSLKVVEGIDSYQFTFVKQEHVAGKLLPQETIEMKIRQKPFSIYTRHVRPGTLRGQEAIFVEGKYDDKIVAHGSGVKGILTVVLPPGGPLAMNGNRHPITDAGMINLLKKLQELAADHKDYLAKCTIRFVEGEKVDDRPCHCLEVVSKQAAADFRMAKARIYLDREWNVPVKYEAYEFPPGEDTGEPMLVESYTYLKLKLKAGLTDKDFDPANPDYKFPALGRPRD